MASFAGQRHFLRFGVFEIDLAAGEIRKAGMRLKLAPQPFQVLQALLEHPQQVVTREELRERVWPDNTFVDYELGLKKAINRLREVLGDSAENPRFIETVPRKGYRFIGVLTSPESTEENSSGAGDSQLPAPVSGSIAAQARSDSVFTQWRVVTVGAFVCCSNDGPGRRTLAAQSDCFQAAATHGEFARGPSYRRRNLSQRPIPGFCGQDWFLLTANCQRGNSPPQSATRFQCSSDRVVSRRRPYRRKVGGGTEIVLQSVANPHHGRCASQTNRRWCVPLGSPQWIADFIYERRGSPRGIVGNGRKWRKSKTSLCDYTQF